MAGNNAGQAAAYSPFLDMLPLEVRNMIYRFAYVHESGRLFPVISKVDWTEAERNRRRNDYSKIARRGKSKRFPTPPLRQMHVSRQFEAEAVQEWFRHHVIDCEDLPQWDRLCKLDARLKSNVSSLRCSWGSRSRETLISSRVSPYSDFKQLQKCKQLRCLQLRVTDRVFDVIPGRMICHDDYEPEDFQRLEQIADFLKLPALQGVILIPETRGMLASMTKEQQVWEANLQSLEDFINQRIQNKQPVLCDEPPQAFTKQPKDLRPATSSELFQYAPMRTRGSTFGEI